MFEAGLNFVMLGPLPTEMEYMCLRTDYAYKQILKEFLPSEERCYVHVYLKNWINLMNHFMASKTPPLSSRST